MPAAGLWSAPVTDELVYTVDGDKAVPASATTLAMAGLKEREHLQEWVLGNPAILGSGVLVVTCEFDRWVSKVGAEHDRLDVLGIDETGHLVVAELKRDAAPDTVVMQALKYAAMASRFDLDLLADAYADFQRKTGGESLTAEEAADRLQVHTDYQVNSETLRAPRVVLIAGSFPANVTATTVWLTEMGLDITLVRVQAYNAGTEIVVTVSQHYPPPDVEDFTVAPARASRKTKTSTNDLPTVEWTSEDYLRCAEIITNVTAVAALDLCAAAPGEWVPFEEVIARTDRSPAQARGDTGGFTLTVRKQFKRNNWPFEAKWAAGGKQQIYYRLTPDQATMWLAAKAPAVAEAVLGDDQSA